MENEIRKQKNTIFCILPFWAHAPGKSINHCVPFARPLIYQFTPTGVYTLITVREPRDEIFYH